VPRLEAREGPTAALGSVGRVASERVSGSRKRPFRVLSGTGRLLEIRLVDVCNPDDIVLLGAWLGEEAQSLGVPPVIFGDYRAASPFSQAVADEWSRVMRAFNVKVARSAIILSPENETFNLQFARVVRCAGSASRRCFLDAGELRQWLRESLTEAERARVDEVLGSVVGALV
jgi:hypothetical protein